MRCKTKGLKLCLSINLTEYVHGFEMNCTQLKKINTQTCLFKKVLNSSWHAQHYIQSKLPTCKYVTKIKLGA